MENESLPLYEGVDWNMFITSFCLNYSLPLYEGVDWNWSVRRGKRTGRPVSLFTREWIEIPMLTGMTMSRIPSPSLRGSGLKSHMISGYIKRCCLPLYEGVDWNRFWQSPWSFRFWSPSLRGSGLKSPTALCKSVRLGSPSLRGSGLK